MSTEGWVCSCGYRNKAGSKFCHRCGMEIRTASYSATITGHADDVVRVAEEVLDRHASTTKDKIRILFLSANADNTARLRLVEECNIIDSRIQASKYRDKFDLEQRHAVSLLELQSHLLRFKPNIVHFSGHGSEKGSLIFENAEGNPEEASPRALSTLFKIINEGASDENETERIRVVVLNACYSRDQAKAISQHVDCVIGVSDAIKDTSATNFAASFYQALGFGQSVQTAFDLGRVQLGLASDPDERILKLESMKDVEPSKVFFVARRDTRADDRTRKLSIHCNALLKEVPLANHYYGLPYFSMAPEDPTPQWPFFRQLFEHFCTGHRDLYEAILDYRKTHPKSYYLRDDIVASLFSLFKQAGAPAPSEGVLSALTMRILALKEKTAWGKFSWRKDGTEYIIDWEGPGYGLGDYHIDDVLAERICSTLNDFFFQRNNMMRLRSLSKGAETASKRYEQRMHEFISNLATGITSLAGACESCLSANLHDEKVAAKYRERIAQLPEEWDRATPRF